MKQECETQISLLAERFVVCSLNPNDALPAWLNYSGYGFVSRTPYELCLICSEEMAPKSAQTEVGWRCLKIEKSPHSFIRKTRADIVGLLSNVGLRTLTLSTYKADYLLFYGSDLAAIKQVLSDNDYMLADEGC